MYLFIFFLHFCAHHRHTPAGESRHSNITGFVQKIHVESTLFTSWFPSKSDAESETRSASKSTIITVCESAKNGAQWNHSLEWVSEMMMGGRRELSACQWQWLYFRSTRERIQLFVQRFLFLVRLKIDLKIVIKQNATLIIVNRERRDEWVKIFFC